MTNPILPAAVRALAQQAGAHATTATAHSFDDARNGLHYVLLRLSLLGLTEPERAQLEDLARLAFHAEDLTAAAAQITSSPTASPLAVAVADLVAQSPGAPQHTLLGAVFGAYAGLETAGEPGEGSRWSAVLGAIAGAVAVTTTKWLQADAERAQHFVEPQP